MRDTILKLKNLKLFFSIFFIVSVVHVYGGDCTWTTTGASTNWNTAAAWSVVGSGCASVPPTTLGPNDNVIINNNMNLTTATLVVGNGGILTINSPAVFSITGSVDLQNGSSFTLALGATLNVTGNFNNSNNSTGVTVNGSVNVGGNLTSGNGSTVTSTTGTGAFVVQGSISGAGTVFGSTADCPDSSTPCLTSDLNTLPVEIVSITAECLNNDVNLKWTTASEHNSSHFMLFKSRNGYDWENLSTVQASGNSNYLIEYEALDDHSYGLNYYKLSQIDIDGSSKTYPTITTYCASNLLTNEITIQPNPFKDEFSIHFINSDFEGNTYLQLSDTRGFLILNKMLNLEKGSNYIPINDLDLAPGIYYIQITNGTHSTETIKVIKQ